MVLGSQKAEVARIGLSHFAISRITFRASAFLIVAKKRVASGFVQRLIRIEPAFSHRKLTSTEGRNYPVFLLTIGEGHFI